MTSEFWRELRWRFVGCGIVAGAVSVWGWLNGETVPTHVIFLAAIIGSHMGKGS